MLSLPLLASVASTLLLLRSTALAQSYNETTVTNQSVPFNLVLESHDASLNGLYLAACHEGAGIEALCAQAAPASKSESGFVFQLNTTNYVCTYENGTVFPCPYIQAYNITEGQPGTLVWNEPYNYNSTTNTSSYASQSMQLQSQGTSTNLAFATLFFPDSSGLAFPTQVGFTSDSGRMNLQDQVQPVTGGSSQPQPPDQGPYHAYERWHVCHDYWMDYLYEHLVWVYGSGPPSDSSCVPVTVRQVLVTEP